MIFSNYISFNLADKFKKHGYHQYSKKQWIRKPSEDYHHESFLSLEHCALVELVNDDIDIVYNPSLAEAIDWLHKQDPMYNLSVLWNNDNNCYYFVVQNINSGYEYKQPVMSDNTDLQMTYEWGLEHILNRIH